MLLSEECREKLRGIMRWAIDEADKAKDDDDHETVGLMVDVAKDIHHMCRKDMMLRHEHPDWFKS